MQPVGVGGQGVFYLIIVIGCSFFVKIECLLDKCLVDF